MSINIDVLVFCCYDLSCFIVLCDLDLRVSSLCRSFLPSVSLCDIFSFLCTTINRTSSLSIYILRVSR